jgi:hypothetical protein
VAISNTCILSKKHSVLLRARRDCHGLSRPEPICRVLPISAILDTRALGPPRSSPAYPPVERSLILLGCPVIVEGIILRHLHDTKLDKDIHRTVHEDKTELAFPALPVPAIDVRLLTSVPRPSDF